MSILYAKSCSQECMANQATGKAMMAAMATSFRKSSRGPYDAAHAGAEHFANADLFYPLGNGEGREAEEAEAGDEDRDAGKGGEKGALSLFRPVELIEPLVQECIFKRRLWQEFFPCLFDMGKGGLCIAAFDLYGHAPE